MNASILFIEAIEGTIDIVAERDFKKQAAVTTKTRLSPVLPQGLIKVRNEGSCSIVRRHRECLSAR